MDKVWSLYHSHFTGPRKPCLDEVSRIKKHLADGFPQGFNCMEITSTTTGTDCALDLLRKEHGISIKKTGSVGKFAVWKVCYKE